jgi:hypothetical protein
MIRRAIALLTLTAACHHAPAFTDVPSPIAAVSSDSSAVQRASDSLLARSRGTTRRFTVDTTLPSGERFLRVAVVRLGQLLDLVHDVQHRTRVGSFYDAIGPLSQKWGDEQLTFYNLLHSIYRVDTIPGEAERVRRMVDSLGPLPGYPNPAMIYGAFAAHDRRTLEIVGRLVPQIADTSMLRIAHAFQQVRQDEINAFERETSH